MQLTSLLLSFCHLLMPKWTMFCGLKQYSNKMETRVLFSIPLYCECRFSTLYQASMEGWIAYDG